MKYLVFEDEELIADMLVQLIKQCRPNYELLKILPSIKNGMEWLQNNTSPDLIFMDIQLSDGTCFEIFNQINIESPVIFTTAYDQYAIQAFKVNSVDYLVKPVTLTDLEPAITKFEKYKIPASAHQEIYEKVMQQMFKPYKQRFLVKIGEQLKYINTSDIAYILFDDRMVYAYSINGNKVILDYSIEQAEKLVDPNMFFRINRKMIINLKSIEKISSYFNHRLKLQLKPLIEEDIIVSRERVANFKAWLDK
ncbi:MAG: response regulator transcription factor [Bacteroidales bacterium]|nr:response regulator transcription factor [Bacteroidales bacterium]